MEECGLNDCWKSYVEVLPETQKGQQAVKILVLSCFWRSNYRCLRTGEKGETNGGECDFRQHLRTMEVFS